MVKVHVFMFWSSAHLFDSLVDDYYSLVRLITCPSRAVPLSFQQCLRLNVAWKGTCDVDPKILSGMATVGTVIMNGWRNNRSRALYCNPGTNKGHETSFGLRAAILTQPFTNII